MRGGGHAQHPHLQFADPTGRQAGIVMEGGNPHMPVEWYRNAYAYVVTEEEEEDKWYIPVNPMRASQRDPRQVKAIDRQHAIAVGLPYDPPSYSEAVETRPVSVHTPPPIVAGLQWLPQHSVNSKPTKVDEPDAEAVTASAAADWKVHTEVWGRQVRRLSTTHRCDGGP